MASVRRSKTIKDRRTYILREMARVGVKVKADFEITPGPPANEELDARSALRVPIIINSFNRLSCLAQLYTALKSRGYENIYVIDNASTYEPLLEFYRKQALRVFYLDENVGHLALWKSEIGEHFGDSWYVYTDPDVVPSDECPDDFVLHLYRLLGEFPDIQKAGLGLRIDDIPSTYARRDEVLKWEQPHWQKTRREGVFDAPVDTTMGLYRPRSMGGWWLKAVRAGGPHVARHLSWYQDDTKPKSDEDTWYERHIQRRTHWNVAAEPPVAELASLGDFFDRIYCINLDRRQDRWERVSRLFERHSLTVNRVAAIDGQELDPAILPSRESMRMVQPEQSIAAIVGGWLSHRRVIEDARARSCRRILVLEDDVDFCDDILERFKSLYPLVPKDWKLLYFGANHAVGGSERVAPGVVKMNFGLALHCFAVDGTMLDSLLEVLSPQPGRIFTVVDVLYAMLHKRVPAYCFAPPLAWQVDGISDYSGKSESYDFLR